MLPFGLPLAGADGLAELDVARPDGSTVVVEMHVAPSSWRGERVRVLTLRDITGRKQAELALRRQERWQAASAEIGLALLTNTMVEPSLALICRRVGELVGADGAVVALTSDAGVRIVAASGADAEGLTGALLAPPPVMLTQALTGRTDAASGTGDPAGDPPDPPGLGARPRVAVPVLSGGVAIGALAVVRSASVGEFGAEDVAVVESLAGLASLALELARARRHDDQVLLTGDRERIGHDLHQLAIQRLFACGTTIHGALALIHDRQVAERLTYAVDEIDATIRDIRNIVFALETTAT